jgi:hypothetical protein
MKKNLIGIGIGAIAGIIDVIPMIFMKLTWDANFSALSPLKTSKPETRIFAIRFSHRLQLSYCRIEDWGAVSVGH